MSRITEVVRSRWKAILLMVALFVIGIGMTGASVIGLATSTASPRASASAAARR
jgi:hypothetical protein